MKRVKCHLIDEYLVTERKEYCPNIPDFKSMIKGSAFPVVCFAVCYLLFCIFVFLPCHKNPYSADVYVHTIRGQDRPP